MKREDTRKTTWRYEAPGAKAGAMLLRQVSPDGRIFKGSLWDDRSKRREVVEFTHLSQAEDYLKAVTQLVETWSEALVEER